MASNSPEVFLGPVVAGAGLWEPHDRKPPVRRFSLVMDDQAQLLRQQERLPIEELRRTKPWIVQVEPEGHLDILVGMVQDHLIGSGFVFYGLSFKDQSTLELLEQWGYFVQQTPLILGNDVPIIQHQFSEFQTDDSGQIEERVLISRHVMEHAFDVGGFLATCRNFLGHSGYLMVEVPDAEPAIENWDFSEVWDEHISYFTKVTIAKTLGQAGFKVLTLKQIHSDGEDLLIALAQPTSELQSLNSRADSDLTAKTRGFLLGIAEAPEALKEKLWALKVQTVVILGANHRTSNFVDIFLPHDISVCVIDDDPKKQGMKISSRQITILSRGEAQNIYPVPDLLIIALSNSKAGRVIPQLKLDFAKASQMMTLRDFYRYFCSD